MAAPDRRPRLLPGLLLLLAAAPPGTSFRCGPPAEERAPPSARRGAPAAGGHSPRARGGGAAALSATDDDRGGMGSDVDEYRNAPTAFLANFMQSSDDAPDAVDPLADIDFDAPKATGLPLATLAAVLDAELSEKEWFVTGRVNPIYFDDGFQFQDPDVKLTGVEEYARGVLKLFDQATSRAEIVSSVVNATVPNTITVTWRLSGRVNIGPGLPIKPYICYTDFTVDEGSGLITFQEDRFDIPGWDILLSALFPFLIGRVTSDPAPEVPPRLVEMPDISGESGGEAVDGGIFGGLFQKLGL